MLAAVVKTGGTMAVADAVADADLGANVSVSRVEDASGERPPLTLPKRCCTHQSHGGRSGWHGTARHGVGWRWPSGPGQRVRANEKRFSSWSGRESTRDQPHGVSSVIADGWDGQSSHVRVVIRLGRVSDFARVAHVVHGVVRDRKYLQLWMLVVWSSQTVAVAAGC